MKHKRKNIFLFFTFAILLFAIACEEEEKKPEPIVISYEVTNVSVYGGSDGAIQIDFAGGEPPYEIIWDTDDTTKTIQNLSAGDYTVTILYDNGKGVAQKTITVDQAPPEDFIFDFEVTPVSIYSYEDGSIKLTVTNGEAPYKYVWSRNPEKDTLAFMMNVEAGTYQVTVTDARSITQTATIEVTQPEFVCGRDSTKDVDGNRYGTVYLCDKCWTTQNLRTKHDPENPEEEIIGRYCKADYCFSEEGAHYSWDAAMNGSIGAQNPDDKIQGICPEGWHIPTSAEWDSLNSKLQTDGVGGPGTKVAQKLLGKDSPSGFNALWADNWGYDIYSNDNTVFWTATEYIPEGKDAPYPEAYYRIIFKINDIVQIYGDGHEKKELGFSIRCIKDEYTPKE